MTDEEFFAICQSNETVLFEREPNGEIVERPLAGWQTSLRSVEVTRQLGEWIRLGWLIDPETCTVYVYRPNVAAEELKDVTEVSAGPELPGFVLDLREIWDSSI